MAGSAPATLTVSTANQNSATAFTPTWTVATNSLIAGMLPTTAVGSFTNESAGGTPVLTDGAIGPVSAAAGFTSIFATAGNSGGGTLLVYTLPASTYGYNLTNITVYSGWGNGGRHAQAYTILYSTVADPGSFKLLGSVSYTGGFTGNNPSQPSANQVIWADSAGATLANNVAAIEFDFTFPVAPNGENGYSGYSEITVQGTPNASVVAPVVSITTSNQSGAGPFTPTWTLETPSLIAGMLPSSQTGDFDLENQFI